MKSNPYLSASENCAEHFGFELRMALRQRKMSCAELADYLGKSRSTVRKWLYMNEPTVDHMRLLIPIVGISFFQKIMPWLNGIDVSPFSHNDLGNPKEKDHVHRLENKIEELERSLELILKKTLNKAS